MSYNNVALAVIPSGIKSSIVYSLIGGNMTFVRGSSATRRNKDGLIEYVDTSVPRLDYDGAIPHLLLEPQRSNELQYSEDFSNAYWGKTRLTITPNANIAPDGNSTADLLAATDTSENYLQSSAVTVSGTKQAYSIFVKKNTSSHCHLLLYDGGSNGCRQWFNLEDGTVGTSTTFGSGVSVDIATIEAFRDNWYKCNVVFNNSNTSVRVRVSASNGDGVITSSIGKSILIWGAQLEIGNHVTSYIPRLDTDIATRSADTCDSGTGDFNSNEGVLFVEIQGLSDTYSGNRYITLSDGTTSNMLYIRYSNTGELGITNVGPSLGSSVYSTNLDLSQRHKIAVKYGTQTSDYKVYINGSSVTISGSFSAQLMTGLDTLDFSYPTGSLQFYGKVRQAVVFNSGLTDTQLAELTR